MPQKKKPLKRRVLPKEYIKETLFHTVNFMNVVALGFVIYTYCEELCKDLNGRESKYLKSLAEIPQILFLLIQLFLELQFWYKEKQRFDFASEGIKKDLKKTKTAFGEQVLNDLLGNPLWSNLNLNHEEKQLIINQRKNPHLFFSKFDDVVSAPHRPFTVTSLLKDAKLSSDVMATWEIGDESIYQTANHIYQINLALKNRYPNTYRFPDEPKILSLVDKLKPFFHFVLDMPSKRRMVSNFGLAPLGFSYALLQFLKSNQIIDSISLQMLLLLSATLSVPSFFENYVLNENRYRFNLEGYSLIGKGGLGAGSLAPCIVMQLSKNWVFNPKNSMLNNTIQYIFNSIEIMNKILDEKGESLPLEIKRKMSALHQRVKISYDRQSHLIHLNFLQYNPSNHPQNSENRRTLKRL